MNSSSFCMTIGRSRFGGSGSLNYHPWPHFISFLESSVTEHVFPFITKLTTNGTGSCVVVGFLVAFIIIGTIEFFSADVAGICLRRLDVGFHVSSDIGLLRKLVPTFVTQILLKR